MMQFLVYILVYPLIKFISILPFRILYVFSDIIFFLLYYIIGYRKKVVFKNLEIAFPEKSKKSRLKISKIFYHNFIDSFLEMIKTFGISNEEVIKRFKIINLQEYQDFMNKHPNILVMSSHYANFEWLMSLNLHVNQNGFAAYKKVKNKYFNNFIVRSRSRFNTTMVPTKELIAKMDENNATDLSCGYGLLCDQSPKLFKTYHWVKFFGVEVPAITGTEMLAKKYNYPTIYFETTKVKRGFYETEMIVMTENPRDIPDFELTDMFMNKLEAHIRKKPEYYFWTHKRFKHMRPLKSEVNKQK